MTISKTLFPALAVHDGSMPHPEGTLAEYLGAAGSRPGRVVTVNPGETHQS